MVVDVIKVVASMPAIVAETLVKVGDSVEAGQHLIILESMKMQSPVVSPSPGIVQAINVKVGEVVDQGTALLALAPVQVAVHDR